MNKDKPDNIVNIDEIKEARILSSICKKVNGTDYSVKEIIEDNKKRALKNKDSLKDKNNN